MQIVADFFERTCVDCGESIHITVYGDRSYTGGHYFFDIESDGDEEPVEYWECNACFQKPERS